MQDLSNMARSSMWPTSQEGGNMQATSSEAMTAPGSQPVDKLVDRAVQMDPAVEMGKAIPVGTDGKPQARGQAWVRPGEPAWGRTTTPDVVRKA